MSSNLLPEWKTNVFVEKIDVRIKTNKKSLWFFFPLSRPLPLQAG